MVSGECMWGESERQVVCPAQERRGEDVGFLVGIWVAAGGGVNLLWECKELTITTRRITRAIKRAKKCPRI